MNRTIVKFVCSAALLSPALVPSRTTRAADPAPQQRNWLMYMVPPTTTTMVVPGFGTIASPSTQPSTTIDVCFVLDTTGSMGGLIDGAKKKIWTIANGIVAADPKATVRFALVPYRDRGDEYVTKVIDLTDDLDAIFADLQGFKADGGGDGPESVNQALDDAVNKVSWSSSTDAVKFLFLVGDAPPHMDYADDVKYPLTCQAAVRKGLIINTVQCGSATDARDIWQDIARKSEGSYVAIQQSGGMVVTSTPMDKQISDLSAKIAALAVPYGSDKQQQQVTAKMSVAAAAPSETVAARAAYNARDNRSIQGRGDLVSDVADGSAKLDSVKDADLPENMRKMSADQRKAYVDQQSQERAKLTAQVNDLSKKRDAYLAEQTKKLAGQGDAFDAKVAEIVNAEMNRKR